MVVSQFEIFLHESVKRRIVEIEFGREGQQVLEVAGDVAAASATFAGLVLVFFGASTSSFDGYDETQKDSVRGIYRRRAWPALAALIASIFSCGFSLYAKATGCHSAAAIGVYLLVFVGFAIAASAILAVWEIG